MSTIAMLPTTTDFILPAWAQAIEEQFRTKQNALQQNVLYLQRQVNMLNNRIRRIDIELEQSRNARLAAAIERSRWTLVANHQEMLFLHEYSYTGRDVEMISNNDDDGGDDDIHTSHTRSEQATISNTTLSELLNGSQVNSSMTVEMTDMEEYVCESSDGRHRARVHARASRERASERVRAAMESEVHILLRKMLLHRRLAEVHHQLAEAHRNIASVIQQRVETIKNTANTELPAYEDVKPIIPRESIYDKMNADAGDIRNALDDLIRKLDI
ncbi:hypothetical protein BDF22DRAFT_772970 [Syncephalis plumigaleata]|nr:hypothetical protein BDF22DRAFT_772970 [Syncephalis plumigaleata]